MTVTHVETEPRAQTVGKRPGVFGAFVELAKLRLSMLAIFAVLAGLYLGFRDAPPLMLTVWVCLGTVLVAVGGNALNMFIERDLDAKMRRTDDRPLPTGRLQPRAVLTFGAVACIGGIVLLTATTNPLATALCATICVSYVFIYTPMKRINTLNTLVGAIPGALPPVVGYAAATERIDPFAVALFLILFFWQIPHFLAIAWRYREDYARAGMKMLPAVESDGRSTGIQMSVYTVGLVIVSLWPGVHGITGDLYLYSAGFLGILFLVPTLLAARLRTESSMRLCFLMSILYLPALLGVMVLDVAISK